MDTKLSPRTPLRVAITGGTSGLGLALVEAFAGRGDAVAFVARHADAVAKVARRVVGSHGIVGDVSRKEDAHAIALQVGAALGGLDVLINNASSLGPVPLALLADTECEDFETALATNLLGPFRLTKAMLGLLAAAAREGSAAGARSLVFNVSSDAAVTPYAGWGAYGASKAALAHMSRIWDEELRPHGVAVAVAVAVPAARSMSLRSTISRAASRGRFRVARSASGTARACRGESMSPGSTATTATPCGRSSSSQIRLMCASAALLAP